MPPRFAPQGRRRFQPQASGGFRLPPLPTTRELTNPRRQNFGPGYKLPPLPTASQAGFDLGPQVQKDLSSWYDRPVSVLGGIARVLGVGGQAAAGAVGATIDDIQTIVRGTEGDDPFSPWVWVKALNPTNNFKDTAMAVKEGYTFEDLIKEEADPDSILYRNKFVVGLTGDILLDPVTYLTFGVTGASKAAAKVAWKGAIMATADEATDALATGVIKRTGQSVDDFDRDYEQIWHHIHNANNRPYTVGDALETLRKADRGELDPTDIEKLGIDSLIKQRGPVRAAARRQFARGGQGIRFAGKEIPGTRKLPSRAIDTVAGEGKTEAFQRALYENLRSVIPRSKLRQLHDDMTRTVAMDELPRTSLMITRAKTDAWEDAIKMFAVDPVKTAKARERPYIVQAAAALRNIFREDPLPEYVPKHFREGLLTKGASGPWKSKLTEIETAIYKSKQAMLDEAELLGMDDNMVRQFEKKWDEYVEEFSDPVDALARWQASVTGTMMTHRAIDQLVQNPMLARPYIKGVEDLDAMDEEFAKLAERSKRAIEKINQKGNTRRQKRYWTNVHRQLMVDTARVAKENNARRAEFTQLQRTHGTTVIDEDQAKAWFQEGTEKFKWRGQTYFVPHNLSEALNDMKNPQFVDREMKWMMRQINFTNTKWKILATSMNPSFHVMNMVGAMWNNMLGGVYNPLSYTKTWAQVMASRIDRMDPGTPMGRLTKGLVDPTSAQRYHELVEAADKRATGGGFVLSELMAKGQKLGDRRVEGGARPPVRKAFTAARRGVAAATLGSALAPDEWIPDEWEESRLFYPAVGLGLAAAIPDIAKVGKATANEVETTVRLTPMRKAIQDESYWQMMDAYSIAPPTNFGRWMGQTDVGKEAAHREMIWDIGSANAIRYQFDYSDLTDHERRYARAIFPFYTFNKNNFVLQVQELVNRPRFINTADDIANYISQQGEVENNEDFNEFLPEYFDKIGMFRVPVPGAFRDMLGLPHDQDLYLNPRLPYASLNLFPALWRPMEDSSITPTPQRWMETFAPIFSAVGPASVFPGLKPMVEYQTGWNLGLARPIDFQRIESGNWRNSSRDAPAFMKYLPKSLQNIFGVYKDPVSGRPMMDSSIAYISEAMATPFINSTGDVMNLAGTGSTTERAKANTFAFISGIRLTPVDPLRLQRGWLYRMQSFLEGEKGNAKRRGQEWSPDNELFLRRIRAQLKVIEHAWDEKEKALYGG